MYAYVKHNVVHMKHMMLKINVTSIKINLRKRIAKSNNADFTEGFLANWGRFPAAHIEKLAPLPPLNYSASAFFQHLFHFSWEKKNLFEFPLWLSGLRTD